MALYISTFNPPAQRWLRLDQGRTATAQGTVPPAQPLPQALHPLLSRPQSRFWALLFIRQSCLVHVLRFSRILSTLRDRLQDVPKPGPLPKIARPGSTGSNIVAPFQYWKRVQYCKTTESLSFMLPPSVIASAPGSGLQALVCSQNAPISEFRRTLHTCV
jgi:hypothetical protein